MGIGTAGLSEAVRPMLGGGNRDLLDNMGAVGLAGPFAKPAQDFFNPKQPAPQQQNYTLPTFQPLYSSPYESVGQTQTKNQTIK